jgi:glucose-6-phosphate 1-epimerase
MNIESLSRNFGAPGKIVFRPGFAGYPEVVIANKYGSAEIALMGANVLSYRPTGHSPVLFRPEKRDYNRGESFHGGIPVCWPQFGNRFSKELPGHGFARFMVFEVRGSKYTEDMTEITLGIKSDEETKKLWPYDFDLEYTVSVSMKLNLKLVTKNTGKVPFSFSCGYHPYFAVGSSEQAMVKGLDGCKYTDARGPELVTGVNEGDLAVGTDKDHVFDMPAVARQEVALVDNTLKRAIAVVSSGNRNTVVWNPGEGNETPDMAAGDWRRFVCVEPVGDWPGGRTLEPGASDEFVAAIQSNMGN